jgi:hypothetical protein
MSRTIRVYTQREIIVTELKEEYYAIQHPATGRSGPWVNEGKFKTKEEAIKRADQIAEVYLERNQAFWPRRIVYVKEIAEYRDTRGFKW